MIISFDLKEVEEFVKSDDFTTFLTNNTEFGTVAFILQVLLDKIDELRGADEE